jgi:hypothetical protein
MILPFSTQLNGKPTYFIERYISQPKRNQYDCRFRPFVALSQDYVLLQKTNYHINSTPFIEDSDRLASGTMIDFFINCRQPTMFRFAPEQLLSIQEIEIKWIPLTIPLGERRPW